LLLLLLGKGTAIVQWHHWIRVVDSETAAVHALFFFREKPGFVHAPDRELSQCGEPGLKKHAVRIVLEGLLDHVEMIQSMTRHQVGSKQPVSPVAAHVVIEQERLEESGAQAPVHLKIPDQEAGHVLTASIGHESGANQFLHTSVHQGHTGASVGPGKKPCQLVVAPSRGRSRQKPTGKEDATTMSMAEKPEKISPEQLENNPVGGLIGNAGSSLEALQFVIDQSRTQRTNRKPVGELGATGEGWEI
jgi:hypothetical protein